MGRGAGLGRRGQGGSQLPAELGWASGDLRAGGRTRVGGGLCAGSPRRAPACHMGVHQGGGGLVKGPERPEAVGTAGLATDRVGGSPGGLGPPLSAPLVQDGGSRGQGGGEVALVWSRTQTLLWGKSTGQPLPGSPAGHGRISQGPGPSHGTPVGRPLGRPAEVRAAALSALLLALEASSSWTGFTDGNLRRHHLPAASSPSSFRPQLCDGHLRTV